MASKYNYLIESEAKCIHYNNQISKCDNKVRTILKIVKDETGKHSTAE
jgi:hypothetical protein